MAKTNLTIQLEAKTVLRAKAMAAARGTSVSALVARTLESMVDEHDRYEAARRQSEALMAAATAHDPWTWNRDELHDR